MTMKDVRWVREWSNLVRHVFAKGGTVGLPSEATIRARLRHAGLTRGNVSWNQAVERGGWIADVMYTYAAVAGKLNKAKRVWVGSGLGGTAKTI